MAAIEIAGGTPDAILAHPNDAAGLDVLKAASGDEQYYGGAPYLAPRTDVWGGLRVVKSTEVPTGSPIVGAFRAGASLYRKGGVRVESSNSHDDYFQKDLVALRAYLRSVAAVHYPEWFVTAETGLSS
jgi:HK97 family phage major capsid protein